MERDFVADQSQHSRPAAFDASRTAPLPGESNEGTAPNRLRLKSPQGQSDRQAMNRCTSRVDAMNIRPGWSDERHEFALMESFRNVLALIAWLGLLSVSPISLTGLAQTPEQIGAAKAILQATAPSEVAARCARLVAAAPEKSRVAVAAAVGQAVASAHPKLAAGAISAIAHRIPSAAPAAAAAAATELPDSAGTIAGAAAGTPGVEASEVIAAVTAALPSKSKEINSAVASALLNAARR